jgi:regulator of ribonuclease activity A
MKSYTADICDKYPDKVQVLDPKYKAYGGISMCQGSITTIKLFEDNKALVELLRDTNGEGKICVVDVEGNYCAVVGDNLMQFAYKNNWKAIIINGYVRDTHETLQIPVGLWALGTYPFKSQKRHDAIYNEELKFGNVIFRENEYIYADNDGIISTKTRLE